MLNKNERYYFLDYLRAIGIIFVVIYHFLFNLYFIFNIKLIFINWILFNFVRDIFVSILIILSGISCSLSKNNLLRGTKIFALSLFISVLTYFIMPSQFIIFGIISFFGVALITTHFLEPILIKLNHKLGMISFLSAFILLKFLKIQKLLIFKSNNFLLFILGISPNAFYSADYYPIFPWIFALISGYFAGKILFSQKLPQFLKMNPIPFLGFIGRHTLSIYIFHQPIILGIMLLIF